MRFIWTSLVIGLFFMFLNYNPTLHLKHAFTIIAVYVSFAPLLPPSPLVLLFLIETTVFYSILSYLFIDSSPRPMRLPCKHSRIELFRCDQKVPNTPVIKLLQTMNTLSWHLEPWLNNEDNTGAAPPIGVQALFNINILPCVPCWT